MKLTDKEITDMTLRDVVKFLKLGLIPGQRNGADDWSRTSDLRITNALNNARSGPFFTPVNNLKSSKESPGSLDLKGKIEYRESSIAVLICSASIGCSLAYFAIILMVLVTLGSAMVPPFCGGLPWQNA